MSSETDRDPFAGPTAEDEEERTEEERSEVDDRIGASAASANPSRASSRLADLRSKVPLERFTEMAKPASDGGLPTMTKALIGTLVLGVIIVISLAAALGKQASDLAAQGSAPSEPSYNLCQDRDCLWEASTILDNMNTSVDPCDDFYEYACGNYITMHPPDDFWDSNTVLSVLQDENDQKLQDFLGSPNSFIFRPDDPFMKAKTYFSSCIDDYQNTATGGAPLIADVKALGGWYALPDSGYRDSQWAQDAQINEAVQTAHVKYLAPPFLRMGLQSDWWTQKSGHPAERWMMQLRITNLGMKSSNDYLTKTNVSLMHQQGYADFMRSYIQLLWRDAGSTPSNPDLIINSTFNDVIYVETMIANASRLTFHLKITRNRYTDWDPKTAIQPLSYLDTQYPGKVNWFELLYNFFPNSGITMNSPVHLYEKDYISKIVGLIQSLSPRQLNNYIMWTIVKKYVTALGWEYIHLNRIWATIKYDGAVRFIGTYNACFNDVKSHLGTLMSAAFIQEHFVDVSYYQVNNIFQTQKAAAKARTDSITWWDNATRSEAKLKYDSLKDKIGYPHWFADRQQLTTYYQPLQIKKDDHFHNYGAIRTFYRLEEAAMLRKRIVDQDDWTDTVFDPEVFFIPYWNYVSLTAGILQHPIFDYRIPQYANFAAMGRFAGEQFAAEIDDFGQHYDHNGYYNLPGNSWWSTNVQNTWKNSVYPCQQSLYQNFTYCLKGDSSFAGCFLLQHPQIYVQPGWRDIAAVRTAYAGYKSYVAKNGPEPPLPGLQSDSLDQSFFIAFAQTFCTAQDPLAAYSYYYWNNVLFPDVRVNMAMKQMPEFVKAFKCPKGSPMDTGKQCPGF